MASLRHVRALSIDGCLPGARSAWASAAEHGSSFRDIHSSGVLEKQGEHFFTVGSSVQHVVMSETELVS